MRKDHLQKLLQKHHNLIHPLIPGLNSSQLLRLDFSATADFLEGIDLKDTKKFTEVVFDQVLSGKVGIGGFFEDRIIYRRSTHYDGEEARSLHLGLDIWMDAGTALYSPLEGVIHSLQDNKGFGNYGPTIIIAHQLEDLNFYLLYGHLDSGSLSSWKEGDLVKAGQMVGRIGDYPENGDWPPHLHWQMMTDMLGNKGDFPGVAAPSERDFYLQYCVDPEYILKMDVPSD
jgi:murein DD-endopeptidase MepM/ murein hydrolase activator NlpD